MFDDRIEATYDYTDEDGALLFQAVRLHSPKTFRQRVPNDEGGWTWSLGDVRRVPYRLPHVVTAAQEGRAVWIVEGEKDVAALEALGFVATCNPMGAGKWADEFSEILRGAWGAIIVADADKPGRDHAEQVATSLKKVGVPPKIIDLAPERDDGYDLSDFLLEHGEQTRDRLVALAKTARATLNGPKLPIVTYGEFLQDVPEPDPALNYLGEFLRGGERVHVIGPIGQGKTTFMAEVLSAAVQGREFLGMPGKGGLRALYVELGDMPEHKTRRMLESARFNPDSDELSLSYLPEGLKIDKSAHDRERIESAFAHYDIIAFDPWYKLLDEEVGGDSMQRVSTITTFFDGLRNRYPRVAVMIGFHANEPQRGAQIGRLGDASGYKVFQRSVDMAVTFERISKNRSRVTFAKSRAEDEGMQMGAVWLVDWVRGQGFVRVERRSSMDELYDVMPDDWVDTYELAELWGKSRNRTSAVANDLCRDGRAESRRVGSRTEFRRASVLQEALDVAA